MIYNIAGVMVDMEPEYAKTRIQSEAYKADEAKKAHMTIRLDKEYIKQTLEENPQLTPEDCEYILLGSEFYNYLPLFGGVLLHASAVVHNGKAYLFSAPSGTGKSTHTQLWLKLFDDAYILNDDKPAIRFTKNGVFVCGTPFSGKTDLNVNKQIPIGGICALERGETNRIEKMDTEEALFRILNQTLRPYDEEKMEILLKLLDRLIKEVPVYKMYCNMDIEAAQVAYDGMKGEMHNEN